MQVWRKDGMATAFDNLAPRMVAELMRDLDLTAEQAAGIVGNGGAESGLLAINEKSPIVPGSRGGYGFFQWTGPRRRAFEKWAVEQGFPLDSYEANYGFLVHELKTSEKDALRRLRLTKTAKAAAETFEAGYERAGVKAWATRVRFAERALALYRASLPPPEPIEEATIATLQRDIAALSKQVADLTVQVAKLQR